MSGEFKPVSVKKISFLDEEPNYDWDLDNNGGVTAAAGEDGNTDNANYYTQYILGTLIVRLVAARGIKSVQKKQRQGSFFQKSGGSTTNAYGEISFLSQTQRTSQIYDALNPTWPRNEEYYFDVSLPVPRLVAGDAHDEADNGKPWEEEHISNSCSSLERIEAPTPILSLCLMHSDKNYNTVSYSKVGKGTAVKQQQQQQEEEKKQQQEPVFIGFSFVDLQPLLTGQISSLDQWLTLQGGNDDDDNNNNDISGEVRLVCEYEPSDPPPRTGDYVKLTSFCPVKLLFPIPPANMFLVENVRGNDIYLSYYTSYESWLCKFKVHRYMVICAERHKAALELYQDQIFEIVQQLQFSPIVDTIKVSLKQLPEKGLMHLGADALTGGVSLLSRWLGGGIDTVVGDILYATNLDGSHTPTLADYNGQAAEREIEDDDFIQPCKGTKVDIEGPEDDYNREALPGMPSCPITGQPMRDPVVAGDGHTYERNAITRWLLNSDISPLTGGPLAHKELVPNYVLISSLSAVAAAIASPAKRPSTVVARSSSSTSSSTRSSDIQHSHSAEVPLQGNKDKS